MNTPTLPTLTGTAVTLRPITDADTDLIVKWRNTPSVVQNFIFRQTFTPEMHRSWLATKVATGQVVQYIILDNADGKPVGSVYYRDIDNHNRSAEYGIFIGEESARGKGLGTETARLFTDFGFGRRSDDGFGELLVLLHSFGQTYAADFTNTALVSTPGRAAEVTANNHFYRETFAHYADGYHRVGCSQLPVGADVGRGIEELGGNLVQHLALEGDTFRQDDVEGRDTVGCYHDELFAVDVVHVTYFSVIDTLLSRKVEISFS